MHMTRTRPTTHFANWRRNHQWSFDLLQCRYP